MNWEAVGAIGEIIGAMAVVLTLVFLAIQLRQNTRAVQESNKLERAAAIDRHADSVSRWRGRLADNRTLAELWVKAVNDAEQSKADRLQIQNHWVDLVNTQRSNYERALVVQAEGLATQAARSIAAESMGSRTLTELWKDTRGWHLLVSPGFVAAVESEMESLGERTNNTSFVWWNVAAQAKSPGE